MSTIQELAERPSVRNSAMQLSNAMKVPFNLIVGLIVEKGDEVKIEFFPRNHAGLVRVHQTHPMPPALSGEAFEGAIPEHELKLIVINAERDAQCVSLSFSSNPVT